MDLGLGDVGCFAGGGRAPRVLACNWLQRRNAETSRLSEEKKGSASLKEPNRVPRASEGAASLKNPRPAGLKDSFRSPRSGASMWSEVIRTPYMLDASVLGV